VKKKILISLTALLLLSFTGCKKSESGNPITPGTTENYFPNNEGTNYKYSYLRIDSTGQVSGSRVTYYRGSKTIQGTTYKIQIDSLVISNSLQIDLSSFRTTEAGVYFFVDTSGFAAPINDSAFAQFIPFIKIDNELLAYAFPLQVGRFWTVFKINLNYPGSPQTTLIDVFANAIGNENIILNLSDGQTIKDAFKIKYTMVIRANASSQDTRSFMADAWLINDIGPAKWEGSGALISVLTGLGIDFADTTIVVKQSLIDYQIK
jgi:hypothetical protein